MIETAILMCYDCVFSLGGEFRKRDDCETGECTICYQRHIVQKFSLQFVHQDEFNEINRLTNPRSL